MIVLSMPTTKERTCRSGWERRRKEKKKHTPIVSFIWSIPLSVERHNTCKRALHIRRWDESTDRAGWMKRHTGLVNSPAKWRCIGREMIRIRRPSLLVPCSTDQWWSAAKGTHQVLRRFRSTQRCPMHRSMLRIERDTWTHRIRVRFNSLSNSGTEPVYSFNATSFHQCIRSSSTAKHRVCSRRWKLCTCN